MLGLSSNGTIYYLEIKVYLKKKSYIQVNKIYNFITISTSVMTRYHIVHPIHRDPSFYKIGQSPCRTGSSSKNHHVQCIMLQENIIWKLSRVHLGKAHLRLGEALSYRTTLGEAHLGQGEAHLLLGELLQ